MKISSVGRVCQLAMAHLILVAALFLSGCYVLYPQYPSAWESDAQIQADPDVVRAKASCASAAQDEKYHCLESMAVEVLNPNVCGLTGIFVDDMCLQAVWEAADDVSICDRIYLTNVRPNCYAHFSGGSTATPLSNNTLLPQAQSPLAKETSSNAPFPNVKAFPAPVGGWVAYLDTQADSLTLQDANGQSYPVFAPESTLSAVEWSPDGQYLLVVQHHWPRATISTPAAKRMQLMQLWQVRVNAHGVEPPQPLFEWQFEQMDAGYLAASTEFGAWSPNGRLVPFWIGPVANSIRNDGLPLWIVDMHTGRVMPLAPLTLLTPHYQSWAPDSSALAFVGGGNRSAQVNKWLALYDVTTAQVSTVVSATEQVPGIVAWSPRGDLIAYAAVPAEETGPEWEGLMTFDNPAIAGRRIYLLDPLTKEYRRLNHADAFQDAPLWGEDGRKLYYVQRHDDTLALMAADVRTGAAEVVRGTHRSLPEMLGYYGQGDWEDYWEDYWQDATRTLSMPPNGSYIGIQDVDRIITAILARDKRAIVELMQLIPLPCTTASGLGGPPKCAERQEEGTLVEVFPILGTSGIYLTRDTIEGIKLNVADLYAVYQVAEDINVGEGWPVGEYGLVFLNAEPVPPSITVFVTDGKIVRVSYNMGRDPTQVLQEDAGSILYASDR